MNKKLKSIQTIYYKIKYYEFNNPQKPQKKSQNKFATKQFNDRCFFSLLSCNKTNNIKSLKSTEKNKPTKAAVNENLQHLKVKSKKK